MAIEYSDFELMRVRRILRRRIWLLGNSEMRRAALDPDFLDEVIFRISDDYPHDQRGSRITDFVDWLIALDWEKIAKIVAIIISLFSSDEV